MNKYPNHICSGRACMFCKVIDKPSRPSFIVDKKKQLDNDVIGRVKELEQKAILTLTQKNMTPEKMNETERLALFDLLTDLYNSRTFHKEIVDEVKRAIRYKRPLTVCLIAIDGFREIAIQYGALTGDTVLKKVADIIKASIRDVDIACRYSKEEFAIMLPETNAAGASVVAERIRQRTSGHVVSHNWHNLRITTSLGMATFPDHGREADEITQEAIQALKSAVKQGGDQVCIA